MVADTVLDRFKKSISRRMILSSVCAFVTYISLQRPANEGGTMHSIDVIQIVNFFRVSNFVQSMFCVFTRRTSTVFLKDSLRYDELLALCYRQLSGCNMLRVAASGF